MASYEEALQIWGANKINAAKVKEKERAKVLGTIRWLVPKAASRPEDIFVTFNFDEGYRCCDTYNPNCYCSQAESPKAEVLISDNSIDAAYTLSIPLEDFDFATTLREIVEAGGGEISG